MLRIIGPGFGDQVSIVILYDGGRKEFYHTGICIIADILRGNGIFGVIHHNVSFKACILCFQVILARFTGEQRRFILQSTVMVVFAHFCGQVIIHLVRP
ncbi:hypothetical protein D3C80_1745290 [compost metagenome]